MLEGRKGELPDSYMRSWANSLLEKGQIMNMLQVIPGERSEEKGHTRGLDLHYNTAAELRNMSYIKI